MNSFFKKLPLPVKLTLVGMIPMGFIVFLSAQLYSERSTQVKLIHDYIVRIYESRDISLLMDALQVERRFSFEYALTGRKYDSVLIQRKRTDSCLARLKNSDDAHLVDFPEYTFINGLPSIRRQLDTSKHFSANMVMQFYTTAIFRFNTLNSIPVSNTYLINIYRNLVSQRLISEMLTYLGIIRTNIYNVLYTRQYMVETLMGTIGTHDVFGTYEKEFLVKATPEAKSEFQNIREKTKLRETLAYIDTLFKTFKFDSSYTADAWWATSTDGVNELRKMQNRLWDKTDKAISATYNEQLSKKNRTLIFLILAMALVLAFITYTILIINRTLQELKRTAQKISEGRTGVALKNMPRDVIGKVADSILRIDANNKALAVAAEAIGKGNFAVEVVPRSDEDLLGNSIVRMKENLREYAQQKERIQNETLDLVNKKDDFMSIASHELKTPVTSLKAFTQILNLQAMGSGDMAKAAMLEKMDQQINKLTSLINDLLDSSKLREGELVYNRAMVRFDRIVADTLEQLKRGDASKNILLKENPVATVFADPQRIGQVLSNLLTNALKYGLEKDVEISTRLKGNELVCMVEDKGIGIPLHEQASVFERFYRISGKNLHTYPGLGLGLYISREIILRHEGRIWLASEEGQGTTVFFSLPLVNSHTAGKELVFNHEFGQVEGMYYNAGKSSPVVIIVNGHNGFYNYGMFPYLQQKWYEQGISSYSFNFSHGGIRGAADRFEDLDKYEKNCMRLETEDLLSVLRGGLDHERLFIFSHSLGAVPAVFGTARAIEEGIAIYGLILAAPVSTLAFWPPEALKEWATAGVYLKKNNRTGQALPQGFEFLQEIMKAGKDWNVLKKLAALAIPVLIIHGDEDEAVPTSHGNALHQAKKDSEFRLIRGAGHTFNTTHPFKGSSPALDELIEITSAWIKGSH